MNVLSTLCISLAGKAVLCGNIRQGYSSSSSSSSDSRLAQHSGHRVDILGVDESVCQSFDLEFDDVQTTLVVLQEGQSVAELTSGSQSVFQVPLGETFDHANVYRDQAKHPQRVVVASLASEGPKYACVAKSDDENWGECPPGWLAEGFNKLKLSSESPHKFHIDLASEKDGGNCRVFEAKLFGTTAKRIAPRAGKHATSVSHGQAVLWTASGDEKCLYCDVSASGDSCTLLLSTDGGKKLAFKNFVKGNGVWAGDASREFRYSTEINAYSILTGGRM